MRILVDWLKDFVDLEEDTQTLSEILTMIGLEAEEGIDYNSLKDILIAEVRTKEKHPNADTLSLCQVFDGKITLPVVCGAPNVASGQKVAFAPVGATLPGGFKIGKAKIRGEVSQGMICSERELGLSEKHDGILVLPPEVEPGRPFKEYLQQVRAVLELDITPNRPDCFSHMGVARDLAAKLQRDFRPLQVMEGHRSSEALNAMLKVEIEDPNDCPRYIAAVVENVHVGPTPQWMVERLEAVGQRSINNVVDISNYVLQEMGHPTHIFDFDKIETGRLVIRRAREGEKLVTLDETACTLTPEQLLITNGPDPLALAGIMGGLDSAVQEQTTTVLIESAYFNPSVIRKGAKHLGLATEASKRFERGADPEGAMLALWRVVDLLEKYAGGARVPGIVDAYPKKINPKPITLRRRELDLISGCTVDDAFVESALTGIGCSVTALSKGRWECKPPTFRPDLEREVDLVEEIVRLHGYDQVPSATTYTGVMLPEDPDPLTPLNRLITSLVGLGFYQCFNNSLQPESTVRLHEQTAVKIMNPLTEEMTHVRTRLLPGLLQTVDFNVKNGSPDLRLFEWGNVFLQEKPGFEGIREVLILAGVLHGNLTRTSLYQAEDEQVSFFALKGVLQAMFDSFHLGTVTFQALPSEKPGYRGTHEILVGDTVMGWMGTVDRDYLVDLKLKCGPVFAFELLVDPLMELLKKQRRYEPVIPYPIIERDLNFVLDEETPAGAVVSKIMKNGRNLLQSVEPVNLFRHESLGAGKKSLTFHLVFQSPVKTLEDKDVNPIIAAIVRVVEKNFNAKLR